MKNRLNIRFADKAKDKDFLATSLLDNYKDCISLGIAGTPRAEDFKEGYWESSFIGEVDGKAIAFMVIASRNSISCARIEELFVVPEYRGRGYATKLLRFAERFIRNSWDVRLIDILTIENEAMENLLLKQKYTNAGSYDKMYFRNKKWYAQDRWIKEV